MTVFGVLGYLFRKFDFEGAPRILAFLGPLLEVNLRHSLLMSGGSFAIFFTRPISCVMMIFCFVTLFAPIFSAGFRRLQKEGAADT